MEPIGFNELHYIRFYFNRKSKWKKHFLLPEPAMPVSVPGGGPCPPEDNIPGLF